MKFIKVGLWLVSLLAISLVVSALDVLEPEQWAMVVLGLLLVGIQVAKTKGVAQPLGVDKYGVHKV